MGDTHADAAMGELAACGLLSPAGSRYRLAAGILAQLEASGYGEDADVRARTAAQHYAWWAGHPSVTPERAVAEADAVLAAMAHLVLGDRAGQASAAVLLARSASPAFAAGMYWGAWEKALRIGQEAARIAGEVAEEAYFHHELGVLALCTGNLDRARAELEASIGMRGALADKSGAVAGRRALALVADRSAGPGQSGRTPAGEEIPAARHDESASPPGGIPAAMPLFPRQEEEAGHAGFPAGCPAGKGGFGGFSGRVAVLQGARRNLVAVGRRRSAGRRPRHGGDPGRDVRQRGPRGPERHDRAVGERGRQRERPLRGRADRRHGLRRRHARQGLDQGRIGPGHPVRRRHPVAGHIGFGLGTDDGHHVERQSHRPAHVREPVADEEADEAADHSDAHHIDDAPDRDS